MRRSVQSIGLVLAFAFVVNYSGMSSSLALLLAATGVAFPFFLPFPSSRLSSAGWGCS